MNEVTQRTYLLHGVGSFLTVFQLVKKFHDFYGIRRFITAFTSARHLSLSWASSIPSIPPDTTSWRFILILSSHLHLGLPRVSPPKLCIRPSSLPTHATCRSPSNSSRFYHPNNIGWAVQSWSSSFCSFFHSLVEVTQNNYKCRLQILFILRDHKIVRTLLWMFCTTITVIIEIIIIIIITALLYSLFLF